MNYAGRARTNYVAVDDIEGLKKALAPFPVEVLVSGTEQGKVALADTTGTGWPTLELDEEGEEIELDVAAHIMPFVREGEVLVLMESGREGERYVAGSANAWVRQGGKVRHTGLSLNDIYRQAARKFAVEASTIGHAEY